MKEAEARAAEALQLGIQRGDSTVLFIVGLYHVTPCLVVVLDLLQVGKGLHCEDGEAKIKPAIEDLVQKYVLVFYILARLHLLPLYHLTNLK